MLGINESGASIPLTEMGLKKYSNLSLEQVLVKDPSYFNWVIENVHGYKNKKWLIALEERSKYFQSDLSCYRCESSPTSVIGISDSMFGLDISALYVYCNKDCFDNCSDMSRSSTMEAYKIGFKILDKFSPKKHEQIINVLLQTMGLGSDEKRTRNKLNYLFNSLNTNTSL